MTRMLRQPEPELMNDDAEAEAYAQADFAEVNQAFADRLVSLAGLARSARAVDLGTGAADIPIRVVRALPGWHIVAVDAAPTMLRLARAAVEQARVADRIELVLADAKDTGLAAQSFDVIFSNSILHHVTAADRLWSEVARLARPGALVFLRDLARPDSLEAARAIVSRYAGGESALLQEEYLRSLRSAYTPAEVREQLNRAGLHTLHAAMSSDRHFDIFGWA